VAYAYRVKSISEVKLNRFRTNNPDRIEGVKIQKGIKYYSVPFVVRKKNGN